jgi:DNA polymerase-3 subunit epsilon
MAWLGRLFGGPPVALRAARWVVIDCETSGLDAARDRLLAVGAVVVRGGRIALEESFNAVLRQEFESDTDNILVHGIGGDAQRNGRPVAETLGEFAGFLGEGLPVAFHAPFDEAVLRRAMVAQAKPHRTWLDLAQLAPALYPGAGPAKGANRALDDWLAEFGIACPERHDALADAYATAQLLLVLLAEAERQGAGTVDAVRRLERAGRWVGSG